MIYLGGWGRLVGIKCPSQQQVTHEDRYSFETTLEGKKIAQPQAVSRRVWSLSTSEATTPAEQAILAGFAAGEWGAGPFLFVSADAPVTNMLTPDVASCQVGTIGEEGGNPVTPGGPVNLGGDEWAGRSWVTEGDGVSFVFGTTYVPVLPNGMVTGSAWVAGANARLRLRWYNAEGGYVDSTAASASAGGELMTRVSITGKAPETATAVRLIGVECQQAARPALTWTDRMFEWGPGEGCRYAVIHAVSKNLVMASREKSGGRYASMNFTVTEVN